jgi:UDP-N-acetylmuramate dehydrogenase
MNMAEAIDLEGLRGELRANEPMARHVSWRAGGAAERLYVPADLDDLGALLRRLPAGEPVLFVGLGSNLLVRDGGWRGTAVLMHGAAKHPELIGQCVYAEAGVAAPKVARFAARHDLGGAEFLVGIPGTVGGALAMNAGCYGGETWRIVERVLTVDRSGAFHRRERAEFETGYRHCALKEGGGRIGEHEWFAAAWFRLPRGRGADSRALMTRLLARRIASQPLQLPNAGSVFRNPEGDHAARLLEACGLKGLERGGARISELHANFIVNPARTARASDIEWLIERARAVVAGKTGIELVAEVRIVGEPAA